MKVWYCGYYWSNTHGSFHTYDYVCVAETSERALELAKADAPNTYSVGNWFVEEIKTDKESLHFINSSQELN